MYLDKEYSIKLDHEGMIDNNDVHQEQDSAAILRSDAANSKKRRNTLHVTFPSEPTTSVRTRPRTLTAEKCTLFWTKEEMERFLLSCSTRLDESANSLSSSMRSEDYEEQHLIPNTKFSRRSYNDDDYITIRNLFDDPTSVEGFEQEENDGRNAGRGRTSSVLSPLRKHRSYSFGGYNSSTTTDDGDEDGPHLLGLAFEYGSGGDSPVFGSYTNEDDIDPWRHQ